MARNLYEVTTRRHKVYAVADDVLEASNLVTEKLNDLGWDYSNDRVVINVKWIGTTSQTDMGLTSQDLQLMVI